MLVLPKANHHFRMIKLFVCLTLFAQILRNHPMELIICVNLLGHLKESLSILLRPFPVKLFVACLVSGKALAFVR